MPGNKKSKRKPRRKPVAQSHQKLVQYNGFLAKKYDALANRYNTLAEQLVQSNRFLIALYPTLVEIRDGLQALRNDPDSDAIDAAIGKLDEIITPLSAALGETPTSQQIHEQIDELVEAGVADESAHDRVDVAIERTTG